MRKEYVLAAVAACFALGAIRCEAQEAAFARTWKHVGETSAVITWHLDDIKSAATSYVEYGTTEQLDRKTPITREPRWMQFHRLTGLETGKKVFYRMVNVEAATKKETRSKVFSLTPKRIADAVYISDEARSPIVLDKPGTYVLTKNITADGTAIQITGAGVTLDLDGHTVTFGDNSDKPAYGVDVGGDGKTTVRNGRLVQGKRSGKYSCAVNSRWRQKPAEISGISTDVHLACAYPIRFLGHAVGVEIHHNNLYSRVIDIDSRHYPGNHIMRIDTANGVHVHDNLLTEGCQIALGVSGPGPNIEVDHNDIRHHQQYVNGYALSMSCLGGNIHHNRVTSTGRGVHLTNDGINFHDNHLDISGHQQLSDLPKGARPFRHQLVELHGIKFEGTRSKNIKVTNNFMRIIQKQPVDSQGKGEARDKVANGVYIRSKATSLDGGKLVDETRKWENHRWKDYWVKYAPDKPAVLIRDSSENTLFADFKAAQAGEYTIYQKWTYVPATPLNIGCYDRDAMNEVSGNTFVALTTYRKVRFGGYGKSGQWASSIFFVGMNRGPAEEGKHSISIHDNTFISNHLFLRASGRGGVTNTVPIRNNTFKLAEKPEPVERHMPFFQIGKPLEDLIKAGNNTFEGMKP